MTVSPSTVPRLSLLSRFASGEADVRGMVGRAGGVADWTLDSLCVHAGIK